jgi:AIPR protein
MASTFEKTLREEVEELAERLDITKSKAFAVWYGKVDLRLNEKEALEAASYDGGNDRGTDFFFVDDEWDRVIIAQWKYYASANKTPKAGDITQLFNVPDELADPQDLRDEGRADLAEAAEALKEARARNYSVDLRFIYPGKKNRDRDKEPNRLVRAFNRRRRDEEITAQLVRLEDLEVAYEDFQGSADRVQEGTIELANDEYLEDEGPHGTYYVATIPGSSLADLYEEHGNRLFDQNVRLFLGRRKGSVNAGISDTLGEKTERGNFWAYNNGITILARGVEADPDNGHLNLTEFSIVNGCQTTVSIAQSSEAAAKDVAVVARIIEAEDPDLIEKIIRFTNSQTPINVWDISARDKLQQKLRRQLEDLDEPWFYALRRGDWDAVADKKRFGKRGERRILPFPLSAQYLAAFRGLPVEAYKEKALLFTAHKDQVFPPDTEARDLLWAWAVGEASDAAIENVRGELAGDKMAEAILKRGARFFVTAVASQLLADRNGDDFVARVGSKGLTTKAMKERLRKYTTLAALMYVRAMRGLAGSAGDVGTMIRRPETAEDIRARVREDLISEKLAPDAYAEKLPKLPGIS